MKQFLILVFLSLVCAENVRFEIEHDLDGWTPRGELMVRMEKQVSVEGSVHVMGKNERDSFIRLVKDNKKYRIRVKVGDTYVVASVPAVALYEGALQEIINVYLNSDGSIGALDLLVTKDRERNTVDSTRMQLFPKCSIGITYVGSRPEPLEKTFQMNSNLNDPNKQPQQKVEPEPSFLRKYWYLIVPAVLLLAINNANVPQVPQQDGNKKQK